MKKENIITLREGNEAYDLIVALIEVACDAPIIVNNEGVEIKIKSVKIEAGIPGRIIINV